MGLTEVNFKHGGGQKFFARSPRELTPTSHFQNDGATSTSADPVSNAFEVKEVLYRLAANGGKKICMLNQAAQKFIFTLEKNYHGVGGARAPCAPLFMDPPLHLGAFIAYEYIWNFNLYVLPAVILCFNIEPMAMMRISL